MVIYGGESEFTRSITVQDALPRGQKSAPGAAAFRLRADRRITHVSTTRRRKVQVRGVENRFDHLITCI